MPRFSILESSKYLHLTNTDADDACRLLRLYEPAYVVSWVHSHPFPLYVSYFIHEAFHIARFLKIYTDLYTELSFVFLLRDGTSGRSSISHARKFPIWRPSKGLVILYCLSLFCTVYTSE